MTVDEDSRTVPAFRLLFPVGWSRHDVSAAAERDLLDRMRLRIKPLARPDLEFQLTAAVKSVFRQLAEKDGIAIYLPTDVDEDGVLPVSITASRLTDPAGRVLDDQVAVLFREHGADFLGSDRSIIRWRRRFRNVPTLDGAGSEQINYLIPVPGTDRRAALLFSTSIAQDAAVDMDDDELHRLITLSDAIIATFSWVPAVSLAHG